MPPDRQESRWSLVLSGILSAEAAILAAEGDARRCARGLVEAKARAACLEALLRRWLAGPGPEREGIHADTRAALGIGREEP